MDWTHFANPQLEGAEYVPAVVQPELEDAVRRAVAAGAKPPLEYVGAGMVGLVIKDSKDRAYKVGRRVSPSIYESLETEWEWLRDAYRIDPEHIVRPIKFDPVNLVLVKAYVEGRSYGWATSEVHAHFKRIGTQMEQIDWGTPEFKDDSYVKTETGFVLVDAGMAQRICGRFVKWLKEFLDGKRHQWSAGDRPEDLGFLLRREVGQGCVDEADAEKFYSRIGRWE